MFQFSDFLLDESSFELKRGGTPVRVERRVFDVLVYLIKNRDRAVTKEELVEQVWKQRCVGESVIARCISSARKVAGDPESIKTIYGRGYRWVAPIDETASVHETRVRPVFFGRQRELSLIAAALDECQRGSGRVVLLSGEAGIGKSRLAHEIAALAKARGMAIGFGRSLDEGNLAYLPFWQAFRDLSEGGCVPASASEQLGFLEPGSHEDPSVATGVNRVRLFDRLSSLLREVAATTPVAIIIDDLHHSDMPSLRLFEWLSEHVLESRVLLVGTYRDAELANDPPRSASIVRTIRSVAPLTIELRGLATEDAAELLAQRMGRGCENAVADTARAVTGGNPFFLLQIAPFLPASAADVSELAQRLPPRVRDAIIHQLDAVPAPCRSLLGVASVSGSQFELRILAEAAELQLPAASSLLDVALQAGLISPLAPDLRRFAFKHELVRQVLYEDLAVTERRRLHLALGRALEHGSLVNRDARASELARHFSLAGEEGDPDRALKYALEAAGLELRRFAWESAVEYLELALRALERSSSADESTLCALLVQLATAQLRAGSRALASQTFARAGELAKKLGDGDALVRIAVAFSAGIHGIELSFDTTLVPLLETALRVENIDQRSRALLCARLALALFWTDDRERRLALTRAARELSSQLQGDEEVLAYVKAAEVSCLERPGSLQERLHIAAETIELTMRTGAYELAALAHITRLVACGEAGDFENARRHALALAELARRTRDPFLTYVASSYKNVLAQVGGDLSALEQLVDEALRMADELGRPSSRISAMNTLVYLRIEQGRAGEVIETARECVTATEHAIPATKLLYALTLARAEKPIEAQRALGELSIAASALRRDPTWLAAMALLSEIAFALPDAAPPVMLYDHLLPFRDRFVPWGGTSLFFLGSVERYLGLAAAAAQRWQLAIQHLDAAVRENTRVGAELAATHAQAECALVLERLGGRERLARAAKLRDGALTRARARGFGQLERALAH